MLSVGVGRDQWYEMGYYLCINVKTVTTFHNFLRPFQNLVIQK